MTNKTPEALDRMIYLLELYETGTTFEAATLLRRQHQRIEALEKVLGESLKLLDRDNRSTDRPNDYRLGFVAQALALLSATQQEDSQP